MPLPSSLPLPISPTASFVALHVSLPEVAGVSPHHVLGGLFLHLLNFIAVPWKLRPAWDFRSNFNSFILRFFISSLDGLVPISKKKENSHQFIRSFVIKYFDTYSLLLFVLHLLLLCLLIPHSSCLFFGVLYFIKDLTCTEQNKPKKWSLAKPLLTKFLLLCWGWFLICLCWLFVWSLYSFFFLLFCVPKYKWKSHHLLLWVYFSCFNKIWGLF